VSRPRFGTPLSSATVPQAVSSFRSLWGRISGFNRALKRHQYPHAGGPNVDGSVPRPVAIASNAHPLLGRTPAVEDTKLKWIRVSARLRWVDPDSITPPVKRRRDREYRTSSPNDDVGGSHEHPH
jgi:hypothetical protein